MASTGSGSFPILRKAALLGLYLSLASAGPAVFAQPAVVGAPTESVLNLTLDDGARQRLLVLSPAHPKATIIMFPGGAGDIGLAKDGEIRRGKNFVVRTRELWAARGYAVVVLDTTERENLRGFRSSPEYARLISQVVDTIRKSIAAPVFLLGTSQGSIAAMNGAAHAGAGAVAGVILTESVSIKGGSHETVFDANPERVSVPALVVANRDDQCNVASPDMAPKIATAMSGSRDVKVVTVSGGELADTSRDCGSLSPHGYYRIESKVVDLIGDWIDSHLAR